MIMKKGKIISFEGLDKSGKHSAMDYVAECLEAKGKSIYKLSFPQYDTEIGKLIRAYLTGQLQLTSLAFEALQSADKLNATAFINALLNQYDFVLIDRYVDSQFAYGLRVKDYNWHETILEDVPYPAFVFYMDVSVDNSMSRQGEHGDNDIYESNRALLTTVQSNYDKVFNEPYRNLFTTVIKIDANQPLQVVQNELKEKIKDLIK